MRSLASYREGKTLYPVAFSSADFGQLRTLGMTSSIVNDQLFVRPKIAKRQPSCAVDFSIVATREKESARLAPRDKTKVPIGRRLQPVGDEGHGHDCLTASTCWPLSEIFIVSTETESISSEFKARRGVTKRQVMLEGPRGFFQVQTRPDIAGC